MPAKVILNNTHEASLAQGNIDELSLDFSYDNFSPTLELLEDWAAEFVGNAENSKNTIKFIDDWIAAKKIVNNIPAEINDELTGFNILNGYVDLTNENNQYDQARCIYKLIVKNRDEGFFKLAEGLSLLELYSGNTRSDARITNSDFNTIRYVLSGIPDNAAAFLLTVTIYLLSFQIYVQSAALVEAISKAVSSGAFTVGGLGAAIWASIEIAAAAALLTFLIIAMVNLLKQMSELLFQKPKGYWTVKVKTLLERGCAYLGYNFQSSLFDGDYSELSYLAATSEEGKITGRPTNQPIPNITLLQLFERIGKFFNAKLKIINNTIVFENKSFFLQNPLNYQLQNLKFNGVYTYNLYELPKSINLKFASDPIDINTLLSIGLLDVNITTNDPQTRGDELNATFALNNVIDDDLQGLSNTLDVNFDFARGYRKGKESRLEKLFNGIWDAAQVILGRKERLENRIGFLLLNSDAVSVDKLLITDGDRIGEDNYRLIHAETIYNRFYQNEKPQNNQWKIYTERDSDPICDLSVVAALKNNNIIKGNNGQTIAIQRNVRDTTTSAHEITYREKLDASDVGFISEDLIKENIIVK